MVATFSSMRTFLTAPKVQSTLFYAIPRLLEQIADHGACGNLSRSLPVVVTIVLLRH